MRVSRTRALQYGNSTGKSQKGWQYFGSPGETGSLESMGQATHRIKGKYTLNLQVNRGFSLVLTNIIFNVGLTYYKYDKESRNICKSQHHKKKHPTTSVAVKIHILPKLSKSMSLHLMYKHIAVIAYLRGNSVEWLRAQVSQATWI